MKDKIKVFMGGTCNNSEWREDLIDIIDNPKIDFFNPLVEDWTEECQIEEIKQRKLCDFVLYVITPFMKGPYSIAEVVDDSNKRPFNTLLLILNRDGIQEGDYFNFKRFDKAQLKSLNSVKAMVKNNGSRVFDDWNDLVSFLEAVE